MSEVGSTPPVAPEAPPVVENAAGVGGIEETGFFAPGPLEGGESPGTEPEVPGQQAPAPPPEQAKAPEQQAEGGDQQPILAKEDTSRFEYWQRQAQMMQKENEDMKNSDVVAIAKYIQSNPEYLDDVEARLNGKQGTIQSSRLPERPTLPQRPSNYDETQALDPETISGQHSLEVVKYQEKKAVYDDALEQKAAVDNRRNVEAAKVTDLRNSLIGIDGADATRADEVMRLMNSAAARDPANILKYAKILSADPQDIKANEEKARQLREKQNGLNSPPPVSKASGESPAPTTDEDDFHTSMRAGAGNVQL